MAKFYGMVGFAETKELSPGVYDEVITERPYFGNVEQDLRRYKELKEINPTLTIGNRISILADGYISEHIHTMRYVVFSGARWKINTVEVKRPRLIIHLGEVYNGPTATTTNSP